MNNDKKEQVICLICGYAIDNHQSFNSHITRAHHIKSKDYYDTYIKNETEGLCKTCGKPTQFINMWKGYREFCCISCMSSNIDIQQQRRDTSMKHFGVEYPHQSEIVKQNMAKTNQERFGADNVFASEYGKQKCKETWQAKYNVDNSAKAKEVQEKMANTCMQLYNATSSLGSKEVQNTIKQTLLAKYNVEHSSQIPSSRLKAKQTTREHFGVDCVFQLDSVREKLSQSAYTSEARSKAAKTRRAKGTRSALETVLEDFFIQNNIPYKLEYNIDPRYPYLCDFYLPDTDTFIEINGYWTHGGHFFDETNQKDLQLLEKWKLKNTPHYITAINVWTQKDIEKRNCAIKNNLNYVVLWNKNDIINYINSFNL